MEQCRRCRQARLEGKNPLEVAILSDHVYIEIQIRHGNAPVSQMRDKMWNFKKLDFDTFFEIIEWKCSTMTALQWE